MAQYACISHPQTITRFLVRIKSFTTSLNTIYMCAILAV